MSNKFKTVSYIVALLAFCMLLVAPVSAQPAASPEPPSLSPQEITLRVEEYMNAAVRINRFSGAVLLARDGRPCLRQADNEMKLLACNRINDLQASF